MCHFFCVQKKWHIFLDTILCHYFCVLFFWHSFFDTNEAHWFSIAICTEDIKKQASQVYGALYRGLLQPTLVALLSPAQHTAMVGANGKAKRFDGGARKHCSLAWQGYTRLSGVGELLQRFYSIRLFFWWGLVGVQDFATFITWCPSLTITTLNNCCGLVRCATTT